MVLTSRLRKFAALVASIPLIIPGSLQPVSAKEPIRERLASRSQSPESKPLDVVLLPGNVIAGEVIAADGTRQADAEVVVSVGRYEVTRVSTNKAGEFSVEVPRGGAYVIASGSNASVVRVWTAKGAPPHAQHRVTLTPQTTIVRAQGPVGGGINPLLGGLLLAGIAAAIAIPIVLNNRDDDAPAKKSEAVENPDEENLLPASP